MSAPQKYRQRKRLQRVDRIVDTVSNALEKKGIVVAAVERWKDEMPTEDQMEPRDKYTIFDRKAKGYRKGVHSKDHHHHHCRSAARATLTRRQRCPSGRESVRESTPSVSRRWMGSRVYYVVLLQFRLIQRSVSEYHVLQLIQRSISEYRAFILNQSSHSSPNTGSKGPKSHS